MGPMDQTNTDEHPQDKKKQADTLRRQRRKLNAALGTYPRYTGVRTCLQALKTPCWVADFCAGACQRKIVLVVVCEMREKLRKSQVKKVLKKGTNWMCFKCEISAQNWIT